MYFFRKNLHLWGVFGINVIQKKHFFLGKVKLIRIIVKKVFLFELKI
jgi:hypothetical protein